MNRKGHENIEYFIGPEVEHTPAYSKRTLFVIGKQKADQIEKMAREYKTPHIFLGANHSFKAALEDLYWDNVITLLLDKGFWVTLDYQAHEHETVLKMLNPGIWQCRTFVPLLGVRIPNVQTSSTNLTIKIDDVDFKSTNPGVWCLHHHEITDSNRFTDWSEYDTDEVIAQTVVTDALLKASVVESPSSNILPVSQLSEKAVNTDSEINPQDLGLDLTTKNSSEHEGNVSASTTTTTLFAAEAYAEVEPKVKKSKK